MNVSRDLPPTEGVRGFHSAPGGKVKQEYSWMLVSAPDVVFSRSHRRS